MGSLAVPKGAASAATHHSTSRASALHADAPDTNYVALYYYCTEGDCEEDAAACNWNTDHTIPLSIASNMFKVSNGCEVRVWLYENSNETGYSLCVRGSSNATIGRTYQSFWISQNTASC